MAKLTLRGEKTLETLTEAQTRLTACNPEHNLSVGLMTLIGKLERRRKTDLKFVRRDVPSTSNQHSREHCGWSEKTIWRCMEYWTFFSSKSLAWWKADLVLFFTFESSVSQHVICTCIKLLLAFKTRKISSGSILKLKGKKIAFLGSGYKCNAWTGLKTTRGGT